MSKTSKKVIESVSATELLQALATLQNLTNHTQQISFSESALGKQTTKKTQSRVINYDQYIAQKQIKNKRHHQRRKSISPLKQQGSNQTIKINNQKSRSHSPLFRKPLKTEKSQIHTYNKARAKENKQNKKQQHKGENINRVSFQSKKILDQKQKKGQAYVPIQFRTEQLLRQKQMKLAKLKKEKQISNILKDKQCTFKPCLNKGYKKVKYNHKNQSSLAKIQEQFIPMPSQNDQQQHEYICNLPPPISSQHEQSQYLISNCDRQVAESKVQTKKYKNDKFNFLLDLIH